jgi:PAS domain S-box-containing protein
MDAHSDARSQTDATPNAPTHVLADAATEAARLRELHAYGILDTPPEREFDDIVLLAAHVCDAPMALIAFVDEKRAWIKSRVGIEISEVPRAASLSDASMRSGELLIVRDARLDPRLAANPLVLGEPRVRFCAGATLRTPAGHGLGGLWIMDREPRDIDERQFESLRALARQVMARLELRKTTRALRESDNRFRAFMDNSPTVAYMKDEQGRYVYVNRRAIELFQRPNDKWIGQTDQVIWPAEIVERVRQSDQQVLAIDGPVTRLDRLPIAGGEERDWMTLKFPVIDEAGKRFVGGIAVDITEQMQVENAIREAERFARSTLDALCAHVAILDQDGVILATNRAWQQFALRSGSRSASFRIGSNHLKVCDAAGDGDYLAVAAGIRAVLSGEQAEFTHELAWTPGADDKEQRTQWFQVRVTRFAGDGPRRVVVAHEDITSRKQAEERLRHESLHDALTGLPNRVLLADRIDRCIARSKRDPNYRFALLFMDLDRFKVINDSLGHTAGDEVLRAIATRLQGCLRESDSVSRLANEVSISSGSSSRADGGGNAGNFGVAGATASDSLARLGGDEFTILLDDLRTAGDPERVAERLLRATSRPILCDGHELSVTASVGIVAFGGPECAEGKNQGPAVSARELLRDADTAMYRAKGLGRNRYAMFDATLHAAAVARLRLESDLRRVVERGELLLHFQPIVSLATHQVEGFEALVRWRNGERLVSPLEFIPVAEDTDLIIPIGAWVMEAACRQLADWRKRLPDHPVWMSINVSRRQLCSPDLVPHLQRILAETGIPPASLKLEITESVMMADGEASAQTMAALKATGVRLAMDDFGTGYSSLSCLHKFPIDVLKIDRSFIEELQQRRDTAAVIQAIVHLAHNLGMSVVAEGVEQLEQVAFLQTLDCDLAQGYVFAKPLSAAAAEQFLLNVASPAALSA